MCSFIIYPPTIHPPVTPLMCPQYPSSISIIHPATIHFPLILHLTSIHPPSTHSPSVYPLSSLWLSSIHPSSITDHFPVIHSPYSNPSFVRPPSIFHPSSTHPSSIHPPIDPIYPSSNHLQSIFTIHPHYILSIHPSTQHSCARKLDLALNHHRTIPNRSTATSTTSCTVIRNSNIPAVCIHNSWPTMLMLSSNILTTQTFSSRTTTSGVSSSCPTRWMSNNNISTTVEGRNTCLTMHRPSSNSVGAK